MYHIEPEERFSCRGDIWCRPMFRLVSTCFDLFHRIRFKQWELTFCEISKIHFEKFASGEQRDLKSLGQNWQKTLWMLRDSWSCWPLFDVHPDRQTKIHLTNSKLICESIGWSNKHFRLAKVAKALIFKKEWIGSRQQLAASKFKNHLRQRSYFKFEVRRKT